MNNEKNFYDIVRSKFNEKEEPFDEANWKSMRKMIDDSRADKKRTMWIAASLLFLLLASGTFALIEWKTGGGKQNSVTASVQNNGVNNSSSPSTGISKQNNTSNATVENSNSKIASNNSQASNLNNQPIVTNQTPSNGNAAIASIAPTQHQKKIKGHRHRLQTSSNSDSANEIAAMNKTLNDIERDTKIENVISSTDNLQPTQQPLTKEQTKTSNPATTTKTTTAATAAAIKAHIADSIASEKLPLRFSGEPRIFNGEKQMISIEAGCSFSFGWKNGNSTQGLGFNYLFGVGYMHYLTAKWFLKTGIQFSDLGNMSSYSYNYQTALSSHVVNDSVITTKRLYYMSIPLQFEHFSAYDGRYSLGIGGTISYLLSSTGSASTYQIIDNNPPANIVNYSQNIQLNGYNKLTASIYGFYRYMFTRHWSAYGVLSFMTPAENKSFFGQSQYLENTSVKVILSYTF
jgi:hypothetical protein